MNFPYPLTIVLDRYTGVYSGGIFTAWNKNVNQIPSAIDEADISCSAFWADFDGECGIGETPEEAINDLIRQLGESKCD